MKLSFCLVLVLVVHLGSSWEIGHGKYRRRLSPKQSHTAVNYYTKPHQEFPVKIMIHIDNVLTKKLSKQYGPKTRRKIKLLMRETILNVERTFRNMSVNQKLSFKLINTKFLKNRTDIVAMDENSSKYLKNYCSWQSEKKGNSWFYSVLLTGLDLFRDEKGKKLRKSTGLSYIRGMCSVGHSCAIVEWNPDNAAYLIAHEIAHSLGISHDGRPYNAACKPKGHMMGSKYQAKSHPRSWSACSMRAFKTYLASEQAWCLKPDYVNNLTTG